MNFHSIFADDKNVRNVYTPENQPEASGWIQTSLAIFQIL